jgi:solute carrier family 35 (UDP-galactose transporter), member B1
MGNKKRLAIALTELTTNRPFLRNVAAAASSTVMSNGNKDKPFYDKKQQSPHSGGDETETTILLDDDDDEEVDDDDDNDDSSVSQHDIYGNSDADGDPIETTRQQQQQQSPDTTASNNNVTSSNTTATLVTGNGGGLSPPPEVLSSVRLAKLLFGTFGIYAAYLSYGLYQEDLYRYRAPLYDHDPHAPPVFRSVWFLQVLESAASIGLGIIGRKFWTNHSTNNHDDKSHHNKPYHYYTLQSLRPFLLSGAAQVFAKVFMSLSLVMGASFPVATLAKSAKIVPVMIGQLLLGGATYNVRDCAFAVLVVSGTVLLSLGKTTTTTNHHHASSSSSGVETPHNDTVAGVTFIFLSLVMDGCVGGLQKKMKRDWKDHPPTTYDYVLFSHISMIGIAGLFSILTRDWWSGLHCLIQYPAVAQMVAAVCFLSVMGQWFIFYVISHFDPLVCATITTTRKIWSVMLSIAFKGYALSSTGYAGLALAILGLAMEVEQKARPAYTNKQQQLLPTRSSSAAASGGGGANTWCRRHRGTTTVKQKKKRRMDVLV